MTPLPLDSPQFTLFEEACKTHAKVRVRYRADIPDDPLLPISMRRAGVETMVFGLAARIDEHMITFDHAIDEKAETGGNAPIPVLRSIPKSKVLEICRLATDPAEAVAAITAAQVTQPKTA